MALEALILTHDLEAVRYFRRVLETASIAVTHLSSAPEAAESLIRRKYDAVIVDCDDVGGGPEVLSSLRTGRSNKNAIAFAIVNGKTTMKRAYELGANFVLDKPLTSDRVMRSVKAAHGLIMRERRRYYRHFLYTTHITLSQSNRDVNVKLENISEGGIAVRFPQETSITGQVSFRMELPQGKGAVEGKGEVVWARAQGKVGVKFGGMPPLSKRELERWLVERMEEQDKADFAKSQQKIVNK